MTISRLQDIQFTQWFLGLVLLITMTIMGLWLNKPAFSPHQAVGVEVSGTYG